jgi:V8-like Glu-specific endopeptidase
VRKSHDGYLYQLSPEAASDGLKAALVAAAAAVAGKLDAATAAVSAALGADTPSFVPGGGAAAGTQLTTKHASLAASLLASLGAGVGGGGGGGGNGSSSASALGGRRRLAHIIGTDDRVEEADYPGWPYTAVGQVLFSQGSCSGVMIGPRSVLTAGHCVYSRKRKARGEGRRGAVVGPAARALLRTASPLGQRLRRGWAAAAPNASRARW